MAWIGNDVEYCKEVIEPGVAADKYSCVNKNGNQDCVEAEWSQVNNHGNVDGTAKGGQMASYTWEVPTIDQMETAGCHIYNENIAGTNRKFGRIVIRNYRPKTWDRGGTFSIVLAEGRREDVHSSVSA